LDAGNLETIPGASRAAESYSKDIGDLNLDDVVAVFKKPAGLDALPAAIEDCVKTAPEPPAA
jgi:hypothetical protein